MAGSIFLDSGCDNGFREPYALLYGHHMADHKMFGDLDLYEDRVFFDQNTTGELILPDRYIQAEDICLPACESIGGSYLYAAAVEDG